MKLGKRETEAFEKLKRDGWDNPYPAFKPFNALLPAEQMRVCKALEAEGHKMAKYAMQMIQFRQWYGCN